MIVLLLVVHVFICFLLVVTILLQAGKGGGLAGAFGGPGGAGQSFFGGRGASTFLGKATVTLGGLFFVSSIALALLTANQQTAGQSLIQREAQRQRGAGEVAPPPPTAPVQPAPSGGSKTPNDPSQTPPPESAPPSNP